MLSLLFKVVIVVFLTVCLLLFYKYIMLLISKKNADNNFKLLSENLIQYYDLIRIYLENNNGTSLDNETLKYIERAIKFSIKKDSNERIIGYANSILKNIGDILSDDNRDKSSESYQKIINFRKKFDGIKENYNSAIKILKHYVDVFPTSLMARMKRIQTMDSVNY